MSSLLVYGGRFPKNLEWIWQALYPVIDKKTIFAKNKEVDMATYTITIDERTKSGKRVIDYLKSHGVIEVPNETTRKALREIKEGKVTRCKTMEEFIESLK